MSENATLTNVAHKSIERLNRLGWLQTALLGLALFLLNLYICHELFHIEYPRFMGTIEGSYIGISRYAMAHWNDLTWFPLWNDGIPYLDTYPPLLHLVVALVASLAGTSAAHAYHWVTALAYCLGPVALFALTLRISGSRWAGFVAGLIYASVSMSAWLIPSVARDLGSVFFPRRLQALAYYGEGPHVSSMTLLTLALLCLDVAMAKRRPPYFFLAAVAFAATATTNWLGAFAIVLIVVPYALAHLDLPYPLVQLGPSGWKWRDLAWLALIGGAAYCLAMPLMPPSTIAVLQMNAKTISGDYTNAYKSAWLWGSAILIALAVIKASVRRLNRHLQFAVLFAFLTMLIALAEAWWNIAIVPQAVRYHLEMEMALAILAAFAAQAMLRNRPRWVAAVSLAALLVALILPIRMDRRYARNFLLLSQDAQSTIEWKMAQWLNQHWTGERVLMWGPSAFWLTVFSDIPELWGTAHGTTDYTIRVAEFAIFNSYPAEPRNAEASVLWFKAFGVHAVGISGLASTPVRKFEGVLDPLWRYDNDAVIYRVDSGRGGGGPASLARVIPRGALVSRIPVHGLDVDPLRPYVAALDDPRMPPAEFRWTSMHSAEISGNLEPGQVLSVQEAWNKGWHATANGRPTPILRDAIGLMYIDPEISGPCQIEMVYDYGFEMRAAWTTSILTALLLAITSIYSVLPAKNSGFLRWPH
jgi:hypothetical protein